MPSAFKTEKAATEAAIYYSQNEPKGNGEFMISETQSPEMGNHGYSVKSLDLE
jgi:hypothetical protein